MNQSFEKHFREKPDSNLYKIYTGKILASYEERLLAQRILKEKGFDFDNVSKYREKWEHEKILNDIEEEKKAKSFLFGIFNPLSPLLMLVMGIWFVALSIYHILNSIIRNAGSLKSSEVDLLINIFLPIVFIAAGVGFIISSRKRKRELEHRKTRLIELNAKFKNKN